jgi:hypothetical protein
MFERFARSWELTKQSAAVLAQNKSLMVFPILSTAACLLAVVSFFVPFAMSGVHVYSERGTQFYVFVFLFYFVTYFIQIFFSCALMAAANMAFSGGRANVRDGLSLACGRLPQILFYSAIAATVGMILRTLEERVGLLGKIIVALMGAAWSIITYFIGPVIIMEGLGGFDGVRRSAQLVKKTWGESVGKGLSWSLITLVAALAGAAITIVLVMANPWLGIAFAVLYLLLLATVVSTLDGIFKIALYRYATWNVVPDGYSPELFQQAFVAQEKKSWFGR